MNLTNDTVTKIKKTREYSTIANAEMLKCIFGDKLKY
jgi:hypothetical protein